MSDINALQKEAMEYAEEGRIHRKHNEYKAALIMFAKALGKEQAAYDLATREPSITILEDSVNSLKETIADLQHTMSDEQYRTDSEVTR